MQIKCKISRAAYKSSCNLYHPRFHFFWSGGRTGKGRKKTWRVKITRCCWPSFIEPSYSFSAVGGDRTEKTQKHLFSLLPPTDRKRSKARTGGLVNFFFSRGCVDVYSKRPGQPGRTRVAGTCAPIARANPNLVEQHRPGMISPDTIISIVVHAARGAGTRKTKQNGAGETKTKERKWCIYVRKRRSLRHVGDPVFTVDRRLPVIRLSSGDVYGGYPIPVPPAFPIAVRGISPFWHLSLQSLVESKGPRVCTRKRYVHLDEYAHSNVNSKHVRLFVRSHRTRVLACHYVVTTHRYVFTRRRSGKIKSTVGRGAKVYIWFQGEARCCR